MKIADIQQRAFLSVNPSLFGKRLAFGTMTVTAGIVGYSHMAAIIANIGMCPECLGAAASNGVHCFNDVTGKLMILAIAFSILGEDVL
jgi:hypothetical protein